MRASTAAAALAALIVAVCAGTARADVAPFASDGADPWSGGAAFVSPLEAAAGTIASTVAGRPVTVRCESDADWTQLASAGGFAASSVLGFVSFTGFRPVDFAELSPDVCRSLESFATAPAKPTKCLPATAQTVRRRVVKRVRGRRVVRYVTRVVETGITQPAGPCFVNGRELTLDSPFWTAYFYTAGALQTLVHESIHLKGEGVEANAECYGMQWLAYAAQQLGDTPDDAVAIAQYYATRLYPQRERQSPAYWSPECKPNGALDLTPNDGMWP